MSDLLKKWKKLKIENFDKESELKRRLKVYCISQYEEDVIVDDKHLLMEFQYLRDNNQLNLLLEEYPSENLTT